MRHVLFIFTPVTKTYMCDGIKNTHTHVTYIYNLFIYINILMYMYVCVSVHISVYVCTHLFTKSRNLLYWLFIFAPVSKTLMLGERIYW